MFKVHMYPHRTQVPWWGVENLGPWDHGVQTHSDHGTMKREGGGGYWLHMGGYSQWGGSV